ncbi:hypothetical protein TNCV_4873371 [Trichonephila clavipes]|nr:hypothetical protein TNCV_4873371 [Trichonephila clavipes]
MGPLKIEGVLRAPVKQVPTLTVVEIVKPPVDFALFTFRCDEGTHLSLHGIEKQKGVNSILSPGLTKQRLDVPSKKQISIKTELPNERIEKGSQILTLREQYSSGRFIEEVKLLTPIAQFTRNNFDILFHLQWSCPVSP